MTAAEEIVRFADVPVEVGVELDRRIMTVRDILALKEGSLIETDRSAGDNIDIYIGGALIGFGEIVIIENTTGIRITDFQMED